MKKFEIGNSDDVNRFNDWFNYCSREQIPYIIIKKTKYSTIEWDQINLKPDCDKIFSKNGETHMEQMFEIFKKYANKESRIKFSYLDFEAKKIELGNAQLLANDLFDLITERLRSE